MGWTGGWASVDRSTESNPRRHGGVYWTMADKEDRPLPRLDNYREVLARGPRRPRRRRRLSRAAELRRDREYWEKNKDRL